jgi:hypothetical protein
MRRFFLLSIFLFVPMSCAGANAQEPCLQESIACTEWIALDEQGQRGLIYRTYPLTHKNELLEHAVIVIHGQERNADRYFRHGLAGAFLADALINTLLVSPRFASNEGKSCRDKLDANEVGWVCSGPESWRNGGEQATPAAKNFQSFDFMDVLVLKMTDKATFPNLRTLVIAGHSAGGQFVNRYQMANRLHEKVTNERNIQISYVVANPSSYTYPDVLRPTRAAVPFSIAAAASGHVPSASDAKDQQAFVPFADAGGCPSFNRWPYGLEHRVGYASQVSDDVLKQQLKKRPVTFLLGELDILPNYGFDSSCAALAQGPTRLARGFAYAKFLTDSLQANHPAVLVPACGHNARCIFSAEPALPYLFVK